MSIKTDAAVIEHETRIAALEAAVRALKAEVMALRPEAVCGPAPKPTLHLNKARAA